MAKVGIEFSHFSLGGRRVMRWILRPEVMMVKAAAIRGQGGQFKVTDTSVTEVVVTCVREGKIIASKHASISDREVVAAVDAVIKKAYAVIFDDA